MTEEFKRIIDEDIEMCEKFKDEEYWSNIANFHTLLRSKYAQIIDGFEKGLYNTSYDSHHTAKKANIETMRQKLVLFKAMEYKNVYSENESGIVVNNTNQMTANINITFPEAKEKIENMSALSEIEIEEILEKLNELEDIVNSTERKTKKWEKAKGIINWIATKGVDVAMTVIPLLMKIGETF